MGRRKRHLSSERRLHRRALQRLERQARPLTHGETVVLRHLLQPVIEQRHYSNHPYIYYGRPGPVDPFVPRGLQGWRGKLSHELARRAEQWLQQIPALRVYRTTCLTCPSPCFDYFRIFVPHVDARWPVGLILHVDLDPQRSDYPAVIREIGRHQHECHLIASTDLRRLQAVIIF